MKRLKIYTKFHSIHCQIWQKHRHQIESAAKSPSHLITNSKRQQHTKQPIVGSPTLITRKTATNEIDQHVISQLRTEKQHRHDSDLGLNISNKRLQCLNFQNCQTL